MKVYDNNKNHQGNTDSSNSSNNGSMTTPTPTPTTNNTSPLEVRVWGDFACFTNSAMKAERLSYSVLGPSAARGILEAIFWKPEISWHIYEIWLLSPIKYFSILRNEVNSRANERVAATWQKSGGIGGYDATTDRAQRHTLALRDVGYLIRANLSLQPHATADIAKYRDQFRRRVRDGRCFSTPYLGTREFSAAFSPPRSGEGPLAVDLDLGLMLYDLDYAKDGSGRGQPLYFRAVLRDGVLRVPPKSELVASSQNEKEKKEEN